MRTRLHIPAHWQRRLLALALVISSCWPNRESLLLTGLPLGPLGLAACVAVAWLLFLRPPAPRSWMLPAVLVVIAVKAMGTTFVLPSGWAAHYYDGVEFAGAPRVSIDFRGAPWTRLERRLDFEGDSFPLHFFNELRYNFAPDRRSPAFSAHYVGYLPVERAAILHVAVATTGSFDVVVDRQSRLARGPGEAGLVRRTLDLPIEAGTRRIDVRYASPSKTPRKLAVDLQIVDPGTGTRATIPLVRPIATTSGQESGSRWILRLLGVSDLATLGISVLWSASAWLAWWRRGPEVPAARNRDALTVASVSGLALLLVALSVAWQRLPHPFFFITSGYDGLAFEEYARKLVLGDWLLNTAETGLRGTTLLYTIGYHVLMSATHVVLGESLFQVLLLQTWLLWCAVVLGAGIALRVSGWPAAVIALLFGTYVQLYLFFPVPFLLRENLVVFMNAALVFLCVSKGPWSTRRSAALGAVAGFNYLTDPINIGVLPVLLWLVYRMAAPEQRRRCLQLFAVAWLACFVTIPLRNFLVTGTPTALPSEGPPTLWYGNRPPEDVYNVAVSHDDHHTFLRAVWTYLVREPGYFLTQVLQRVFFTFGFHSARHYAIPIYVQFSLVEFVTWVLAALGATLAIRQRVGSVVIVMLAACRWASMVVFLATERYLVTLVFLLVPLAAVGLHSIWRFRPMLAALVVLALGTEHYIRTSPNLGPHVAWPGGRLIGSASYHTMRQRLSWQSPIKVPLRWTFPEDTAQWQPTPTMGVIDDETPTFQFLLGDEGVIASPQLGVAAPLIEAVEIEARFTGMDYMARLVWHRPGMQPGVAFFPVDGTGVRRTYRVAVWQSRDWSGMIDSIAIGFNGDSIEPTRIELVPYADVVALVTRPPATATH